MPQLVRREPVQTRRPRRVVKDVPAEVPVPQHPASVPGKQEVLRTLPGFENVQLIDQELGDRHRPAVATVEGLARGRACWAAGQIGESAHPGQRVSAKDPLATIGGANAQVPDSVHWSLAIGTHSYSRLANVGPKDARCCVAVLGPAD